MKFLILFCVLTLCSILHSQKLDIKEPKWVGDIVYIKNLNTPIKLEMKKAFYKTKANASVFIVGIGKVKSKTHVTGTTSSLIIEDYKNIQFLVKYTSNLINPKSVISIIPLEKGKKTRFIKTSSVGTYSGAESMNINYIPFKAEQFGETSYLITIPKIDDGEYAISLSDFKSELRLFTVKVPLEKRVSDVSIKRTREEFLKDTIKSGDTVLFKKGEEEKEGIAIEHQYYGLKLSYNTKGKIKKKVIPYHLISLKK